MRSALAEQRPCAAWNSSAARLPAPAVAVTAVEQRLRVFVCVQALTREEAVCTFGEPPGRYHRCSARTLRVVVDAVGAARLGDARLVPPLCGSVAAVGLLAAPRDAGEAAPARWERWRRRRGGRGSRRRTRTQAGHRSRFT